MRIAGQYFDEQSGLDYTHNRYYNPEQRIAKHCFAVAQGAVIWSLILSEEKQRLIIVARAQDVVIAK